MQTVDEAYIVNTGELSTGDIVLWIEINGMLKKVHNAKLNLRTKQKTIEISGTNGNISVKQLKNSLPKPRIILP